NPILISTRRGARSPNDDRPIASHARVARGRVAGVDLLGARIPMVAAIIRGEDQLMSVQLVRLGDDGSRMFVRPLANPARSNGRNEKPTVRMARRTPQVGARTTVTIRTHYVLPVRAVPVVVAFTHRARCAGTTGTNVFGAQPVRCWCESKHMSTC